MSRILQSLLVVLLVLGVLPAATAQDGTPPLPDTAPLRPADGATYDAVIRTTSFGIPHIVADDWASLGYGHGYATATDSLCNLADTLMTARGERSRYLGDEATYSDQVTLNATNLQVDAFVTSLRDRGVVEALVADPENGPSERIVAMIEGYVAGVNRYVDDIGGADGVTDPACAGADWIQPAEPMDLFYGIYLANVLASAGVFVPQIVDAEPPSATDPGTPVDPGLITDIIGLPGQEPTPEQQAARDAFMAGIGRDPSSAFGSNAWALGADATDEGGGMVLGNPHFPWTGRYRFHQAQLTIPGVYDVAGSGLTGSPVINIGFNHDVAWSHTVSTAYRFTPYEYRLAGPTTIITDSGPVALERDEVTIEVLDPETGEVTEVTEDLYRTPVGFVLDAPELFMGWSPLSVWSLRDANAEHLRTLDVFLEFGEATTVQELLDAHTRTGGLPWVNTLAADRHGDALYADHSVVPHVTDEMVTECATPVGQVLFEVAGLPGLDGTRAGSTCAWGIDEDAARPGIFGADNLPSVITRSWAVNANDSYWLPNPELPLEGYDRIIGCEQCERTLRTRVVYRYLMDPLAQGDTFDLDQLAGVEVDNRVHAGELARATGDAIPPARGPQDAADAGDLGLACAAADVDPSVCEVLAAWDGRSNVDSVGTILFREIWLRAPQTWEVAFDADDAVNTPRDLDESDADLVTAIEEAVAFLDAAGIAIDAPLGSEQVAGDQAFAEEARIPIHGGDFATGNANAVIGPRSSRGTLDAEDDGPLYAITYGSSHIQAVHLTEDGPEARTIATFGNADDPTSPHATDQTELWSAERWVDWAFTEAEILADPGYSAVHLRADTDTLTDPATALDPGEQDDVLADPPLRVERAAGGTRTGTAVAVSRRTVALADTVVIARAGDFADALAGAPLAAALDGPLLLSGDGGLDPATMAEVERLGATRAVVLGGPAAVGPAVVDQLTDAGLTVERIAGADRYATAAAIAAAVESPGDGPVFLATGEGFADGVSAAGVAGALGAPVVLTASSGITDEALALLEGRDVVIVGGPAAVPESVAGRVTTVAASVSRAGGADRFATAQAVLAVGVEKGLEPTAVVVASGGDFPDALTAGVAAARLGTGVLLAGTTAPALPELDLDLVLVAGGPAAVGEGVVAGLG